MGIPNWIVSPNLTIIQNNGYSVVVKSNANAEESEGFINAVYTQETPCGNVMLTKDIWIGAPKSLTINEVSPLCEPWFHIEVTNSNANSQVSYRWNVQDNTSNSDFYTGSSYESISPIGSNYVILYEIKANNRCGSKYYSSTLISPDCGSGVVFRVGNVNIYPNPAHDQVTIDLTGDKEDDFDEITIINDKGIIVYNEKYAKFKSFQIDVGNFYNGVYQAVLRNKKTGKLLSQNFLVVHN